MPPVNPVTAILVAALLASAVWIFILRADLRAEKATSEALAGQAQEYRADADALRTALQNVNAKLAEADEAAKQQTAQYRRSLDAANKRAEASRQTVIDLLSKRKPDGMTDAEAASRLIDETLRKERQ